MKTNKKNAKPAAARLPQAPQTPQTSRAPAVAKPGVLAVMRGFRPRFRLLPVTIFAAVLLLGVRVADLWQVATNRNAPLPEIAATQARDATPKDATPMVATGREPQQPPGRMQLAQANTGTPAREPAGQGNGTAADKKAEAAALGDGDALSPINNEQLLKHYADRRAELEKSAKDVSMREALLSAAEKRIEQKLKELEGVRNEIQNLLKMGDERQSQQLESLVKIYETMKPKEAARIFEQLDLPVLLDVFQKMKETKTAPILAAMDPMKAKEVTSALVEKRILPAVPQ